MSGNDINLNDEQDDKLNEKKELDDLEKDILWQQVIKNIYDISEDINLNDIIDKIEFKNPRPAINIYISEQLKKKKEKNEVDINNKKKFKEINSQLSEEFNKLPKNEKKVYQALANKERNKYEIDFLLIKEIFILKL